MPETNMIKTQSLTVSRPLISIAITIAFTVGCLTFTGCDLGTYSKRLKGTKVVTQPSADTEIDDTVEAESQ
ncbi:MAG: hypothetical protein ACI87E_000086 [Mariniblastus sp.]|jgi:hypothetical protein